MRYCRGILFLLGLSGLFAALGGTAAAQDAKAAPASASITAIDRAFEEGVAALERRRLEQLAALAATQKPAEANITYQVYFQDVLEARLYREGEAIAKKVLAGPAEPTAEVAYLAAAVDILAQVDRGDFRQAVESLKRAVQTKKGVPDAQVLPITTRVALLELFFQKLVQNDQFTPAREALELIRKNAEAPGVADYAAARLKRLALIGQPAPPINGDDLDGKPYRLADSKGNVVLVIFWASWCLPNAQEIHEFEDFFARYRAKGLRVVGVNLDTAQEGDFDTATILPNVRRFVLDYNVPWPNLLNGPGERDHAAAYAISDIPANVLIGRDGKVIQMDLGRSNRDRVVEAALNAK